MSITIQYPIQPANKTNTCPKCTKSASALDVFTCPGCKGNPIQWVIPKELELRICYTLCVPDTLKQEPMPCSSSRYLVIYLFSLPFHHYFTSDLYDIWLDWKHDTNYGSHRYREPFEPCRPCNGQGTLIKCPNCNTVRQLATSLA